MKPSTAWPESFFRIIDNYVLCHHKLRMPDEFDGELSDLIKITTPVGESWHIGVEKVGETLLLHDGWQKFMEHHSVGRGYYLIFNYEGNSKFDVHIFDLTCVQIQYPVTINARKPENPSFTVTMRRYNLRKSFVVGIPCEFSNKHPLNNVENIMLQDSDGKEWPVRCIRRLGKAAWLSKGWRNFAQEKKLVCGDVCCFELIQGNEPFFKISVFPAEKKE